MLSREFDYELPESLIVQAPPTRREDARLLVLRPGSGGNPAIEHRGIRDLPSMFGSGDVLVVNETKVFPARLRLRKAGTGGAVEALLVREEAPGTWEAMLRPSGRLKAGLEFVPAPEPQAAPVMRLGGGGAGRWTLTELMPGIIARLMEEVGEMPLPPYIARPGGDSAMAALDRERYQTVYARVPGSIAAPTAGLHFTPALMAEAEARGVVIARVVLHIGPGTFKLIRADDTDSHVMDPERFEMPRETVAAVAAARAAGKRVIPVGTSSVRVLETVGARLLAGERGPFSGEATLFIQPGHSFAFGNGMLTNFHLPRSAPYAMTAAMAGLGNLRAAYRAAIEEEYRFLSYGDAMLILR